MLILMEVAVGDTSMPKQFYGSLTFNAARTWRAESIRKDRRHWDGISSDISRPIFLILKDQDSRLSGKTVLLFCRRSWYRKKPQFLQRCVTGRSVSDSSNSLRARSHILRQQRGSSRSSSSSPVASPAVETSEVKNISAPDTLHLSLSLRHSRTGPFQVMQFH